MKIALAHFRVDETDGVSLEMEKWKTVLEKAGHQVIYLSGSKNVETEQIAIPELNYRNPINIKINQNAYQNLVDYDSKELEDKILIYADQIEKRVIAELKAAEIELVIVNNIWSLGWNLAAGIAFTRVIKQLDLPAIGHHHDFHWEREQYSRPTCSFVGETLEKFFPPAELSHHVVINRLAKDELKKRKGFKARVVPNVFDFEQPHWVKDQYNSDLRDRLGLAENDIVLLQATRVAERKAIEQAVELTAALENRRDELQGSLYNGKQFSDQQRIVLVLAGLKEADQVYLDFLEDLAANSEVELLWINDLIEAERMQKEGEKYYSLWDAYTIADLITYPSILEGWGNQFLEAIFVRKPIALYEYPVFADEIKEKGFLYASFGDSYQLRSNGYTRVADSIVEQVADKVIRYLKDANYRKQAVQKNFELGKKYYSYQVLAQDLKELLSDL